MSCKGCKGHCRRRDVVLSPTHAGLCAKNSSYAKAWDSIHGVVDESVIPDSYTVNVVDEKTKKRVTLRSNLPVRAPRNRTPPKGLGDAVESALTAVGITSARVEAWLGKKCNCKSRKEKLNKLSKWASRVLTVKAEDVSVHEDSFERIVGKERDPVAPRHADKT